MVRNPKRKALYEVIGKPKVKSSYSKNLEQMPVEMSVSGEPDSVQMPERAAWWPKRPRMIQYNAGRIEISIPYQIAIAVLLGLVLLVLSVFRFGQFYEANASKPVMVESSSSPTLVERILKPLKTAENTVTESVISVTGNNRIVIQTWQIRSQLEPVKQFFSGHGIETEIRKISDMYYLITKDKYSNPQKAGTDGYYAKQKIIKLGSGYKAPAGYGSFGAQPFHDAYGMRFDN